MKTKAVKSPDAVWQAYPQNIELAKSLAKTLNCHAITAQLLLNRGIRSVTEAKAFLFPELDAYQTPFLSEPLAAAIELISDVVESKGPVFVYGDYDVDGVTSTTIMVDILRRLGVHVDYMIPDRFKDGYGLGKSAVQRVLLGNYSLMIALDCGISNWREIEVIRQEKETKVLIMDHHKTPQKLPDAQAILNPRDQPEGHPFGELCTAGIVYCFWMEAIKAKGWDLDITDYLDVAALGTVADMMPLSGQNRVLTMFGLKQLSSRNRDSLRILLERVGFKNSQVTSRDIGFVIAPRLNAAGRLVHAKAGVELLLAGTTEEMFRISGELDGLNQRRREMGQLILAGAEAQIKADPSVLDAHVVALSGEDWHTGIIGITAAQLVRKHGRPAVMITEESGICRGSARSVPGVDIYQVLKACDGHFETFGGHAGAAGFSMLPEKVPAFLLALREISLTMISSGDLVPVLDIDIAVDPKDMTLDLVSDLAKMEPFGMGNPQPVFYTNQLRPEDFRTVGDGSHLKASFRSLDGKTVVDAIGFGMADKLPKLYEDQVELAFHLETNEWGGVVVPQLRLVGVR
ncbi:single-stranded-DNA-specific exonuclease RecJ [bacterium]|nr:single-stranded-DNA-specific exonuclease RecJ [bacterium]